MKKLITLITILVALISTTNTKAQTYTFNWGSSFASPWVAGSSATHTTTSIGGSGVTATVSFSSPEATAMSAFSGFSSPQISSAGFPFNTQLGSNVSNLAWGMNLTSKSDYIDLTITFSATVSNVVFNVADIDKNSNNTNTYFDEILVTGKYGAVPVTNPVLSKINGTAVNNTTDTALISGNMAYSNPVNNKGGNTASSSTEQNGTVQVNFGIVPLTSITIRYQNYTGSQTNPADQAIGIGNINFQKASVLPVVLTSFTGVEKNDVVELNWATAQEVNSADFIVEKSNDGINWKAFATVAAAGNSSLATNYSAADAQPSAVNYYRLKEVDADGAYIYSKTLTINGKAGNNITVKIYPNPVTSTATISTSSTSNKTVHIKVYSGGGMLVKEMTRQMIVGTNNIDIPAVNTLPNGIYTIAMDDTGNNKPGSIQFIKQ